MVVVVEGGPLLLAGISRDSRESLLAASCSSRCCCFRDLRVRKSQMAWERKIPISMMMLVIEVSSAWARREDQREDWEE